MSLLAPTLPFPFLWQREEKNNQLLAAVKQGHQTAASLPERTGSSLGIHSISTSSTSDNKPPGLLRSGGAQQSLTGSPRGWHHFWSSLPAPRACPCEASFRLSISICPLLEALMASQGQNPAPGSDRIQRRRESEARREGGPQQATSVKFSPAHYLLPSAGAGPQR